MKFRKGQKVICINEAKPVGRDWPVAGNVYTVKYDSLIDSLVALATIDRLCQSKDFAEYDATKKYEWHKLEYRDYQI